MAREFWAADCETDPFLHGRMPEPFIFGAYNGEDYEEFSSADAFVNFFYNKNVVVYAHNGGKFDWHFILDALEPGIKIQVINGRLAKFKIGQAEFRDSYSLLPFPLAAWQKDVFDYTILEKEKRALAKNKEKIRRYLRSDCVNLWDILSRFFKDYGRKLTLASASMAAWRKISGETVEDDGGVKFYNDFSPYYYGGRVECFKKGSGNDKFSVVDINSAYPFAMSHEHPWGHLYYTDNRLPKDDSEIARSFITLETRSTGAFPFRSSGNGLEFPSDHERRLFHITGWEYLASRDLGLLDANTRVKKVLSFADKISFTDYVTHFYNLKNDAARRGGKKSDGDPEARADYIFAKLFMNSLYGKFASDPQNYSEYLTVLPDEQDSVNYEHRCRTCRECDLGLRCPASYLPVCELHNVAIVSRPLPEQAQRFYNVAVGASITGFVRAHLFKALAACKTPLYCDTDSIAAVKTEGLKFGSKLGEWTDEGKFDTWHIAGKKLYLFEHADGRHKSASKGSKLTADEIRRVSAGAEIEYRQDAPTFGLRGKKFTVRKIRKT